MVKKWKTFVNPNVNYGDAFIENLAVIDLLACIV